MRAEVTSPRQCDPRVVIFTDDPGWHGRSLTRAFAARGIDAVYRSLTDCSFTLAAGQAGIVIPGFAPRLPRGVFVRGVPGGSLERVILRLDVLHALADVGIPVFNSGRVIERTVDKALTSFLLAQQGLPIARTWVCESLGGAREAVAGEFAAGRPVVLKPLFGSQGEGLQRLEREEDLVAATPVGGVYYLQEYLAPAAAPYRDWRVMVIDGQACFSMERRGEHWITNRAQGATCLPAALSADALALAEAAAAAVGADYAGVDLMCAPDGRWVIGEVNGVPAWWGLARATGADVTEALVAAFCRRLAVAG
jgi:tetrahydromethanopterin:alpha-L-glutamate ligase